MALLSRPSLRGSVRRPPELDGPKHMEADRRKSSPDCLDTTVEEAKAPSPPKSQSRTRNRGASSSSVHTAISAGQLATPARNEHEKSRARREPATPFTDLLNKVHESPDPLDTISPALKQRRVTPAIADGVSPPVSPVTRTRRNVNRLRVEGASATPDLKSDPDQIDEKSTGRRSLRSTDTGLRCKSELAQYFHNYEQIISLEEPEPGKPCHAALDLSHV